MTDTSQQENRLVLIVYLLLFLAITPFSSAQIILKVNSSSYIMGSPAKLQCEFSKTFTGILQWTSVEHILPSSLRCRQNMTCDSVKGYKLSRNGSTISLVINHVYPNASSWTCSDVRFRITETTRLNIIERPTTEQPTTSTTFTLPLDLTLIKHGSSFRVDTSCSLKPMNLTCTLKDNPLKILDKQTRYCGNSSGPTSPRKHTFGTLDPSNRGTIKCTVTRIGVDGTVEKISRTYRMNPLYPYIAGAVILILGLITGIVAIAKQWKHISCGAIAIILIGVGFFPLNHVWGVSIAFWVVGGLVGLGTILHKIYTSKETLCHYSNTVEA